MNNNNRQHALHVLRDHVNHTHTAVHNAIIDLRRNDEIGDEKILRPFMNHYDSMVVAATLYTLFKVQDQRDALRPLIERIVTNGDEREYDDMDHPIQCTAITLLADFGKHDSAAVASILEIAENHITPETPRKRAWQKLAELYGMEWPLHATEEMILRPESEASEGIRSDVRHAMAMDKSN